MAARQEQKDIKFSGFTTLPDDYQSADGAIAFATGAVFESGGLKAIPDAWRQKIVVGETAKVYLHHTVNYYHYVIVYQKINGILIYILDKEEAENYFSETEVHCIRAVYYVDEKDGKEEEKENTMGDIVDTLVNGLEGETFVDLVCVGNTLILSTDKDIHYYLCKPGVDYSKLTTDEEKEPYLTKHCIHPYIYLGNKIPSVDIQFGLELECKMKMYFRTGVEKVETKGSLSGDDMKEALDASKIIGGIPFYLPSGGDGYFSPNEGTTITLEKHKYYCMHFNSDVDSGCQVANGAVLYGYNLDNDPEKTTEVVIISGINDTYSTFCMPNTYEVSRVYLKHQSQSTTWNRTTGLLLFEELAYGWYNLMYAVKETQESYDAVFGCINKFVNDFAIEKNKFIHPFYVRYAVRMFDSSVCEISTPILMTPNSNYTPYVYCNPYGEGDDPKEYDALSLFAFIADLKYKMTQKIDKNWQDIIQSIDIYVSPPIYPYDQGKEFSEREQVFAYKDHIYAQNIGNTDEGELIDEVSDLSFGIGKLLGDEAEEYKKHSLSNVSLVKYGFNYTPEDESERNAFLIRNPWRIIQTSPKDQESLDDEIKDMSTFFLIKKVNFDDLQASDDFQDIGMEDGTLSSLEGRESLSEDVLSYEKMIGGNLISYNNRLHIYGGNIVFRDFVFPSLQVQHNNIDNEINKPHTAYVFIRTNDGTRIVKTDFPNDKLYTSGFVWFFYPNNRAFQLVLHLNKDEEFGDVIYKFPLSEHNFLNGACFFLRTDNGLKVDNPDLEEYKGTADDIPSEDEINNTLPSTSIYVSEVDNPFTFKNSTTVTAGSGKVLALSTAAQAMSQGQFGQYPMYVFTDEGLWALSVDSVGTYSTSQPIARDVVTNINSITQLDTSVLFVSDRGIMEVAGSKVTCITDSIDGESGQFNPLSLPSFTELFTEMLGYDTDDEDIVDKITDMFNKWARVRFFDFIKDCRILYDYTHQRIIVYNPTSVIAYNYSISSAQWSMMFTRLKETILSYPDALALREMTDEEMSEYFLEPETTYYELVNMSEYGIDHNTSEDESEDADDEVLDPMLFVTRPMKIGMPDIYKTIDTVVLRGYFQQSTLKNHIIGTVLYASPDLFNWYLVGQSKTEDLSEDEDVTVLSEGHAIRNLQGTPYKYFRLLVACGVTKKESISGCSLLYERKDDNILR